MTTSNTADRFALERELWDGGLVRVAGVDEAGCGPLAGPVVAAAAILPRPWSRAGLPGELEGLNDSKQLTAKQREQFFAALTGDSTVRYAIAQVEAAQIDVINILRARHLAMNMALDQLDPAPQHVLVDGRRVPTMRFPNTAVVKGDALSYSIAAGSVLAKVTRDRLMLEYDRLYPEYGFAEHKGYGTAHHLRAIQRHGPCPIHRRSFAPFRAEQRELLLG